jgi:hypothetical protein
MLRLEGCLAIADQPLEPLETDLYPMTCLVNRLLQRFLPLGHDLIIPFPNFQTPPGGDATASAEACPRAVDPVGYCRCGGGYRLL